jgi:hypothetical protein
MRPDSLSPGMPIWFMHRHVDAQNRSLDRCRALLLIATKSIVVWARASRAKNSIKRGASSSWSCIPTAGTAPAPQEGHAREEALTRVNGAYPIVCLGRD